MEEKNTLDLSHYEMLFIVSNKFSETEVADVVKNIKSVIEKNDGVITYEEDWGKKKLAYPIKHFNHGHYALLEFDLEPPKVKIIDRAYRMMTNELLRHQIVNIKKRTPEEIKKDKEKNKKAPKQKEISEKAPTIKKEKNEKVDMKQLDEKLDKILDTDDLI